MASLNPKMLKTDTTKIASLNAARIQIHFIFHSSQWEQECLEIMLKSKLPLGACWFSEVFTEKKHMYNSLCMVALWSAFSIAIWQESSNGKLVLSRHVESSHEMYSSRLSNNSVQEQLTLANPSAVPVWVPKRMVIFFLVSSSGSSSSGVSSVTGLDLEWSEAFLEPLDEDCLHSSKLRQRNRTATDAPKRK